MKPLIVALDVETDKEAVQLTKQLSPLVNVFKVGPILFLKYGGALIKELKNQGAEVFLDLKFHDIPSVVQRAVERAGELGVYSVTVHTSGGAEMLKQAAAAKRRPRVWGVTVLTSLDQNDLSQVGVAGSMEEQAKRLATLASECGLDGVISSVRETRSIKAATRKSFQVVTPGVRLAKAADDQKRIQTPAEAVQNGADFFVMGRPIIEAKDPVQAVKSIYQSIEVAV